METISVTITADSVSAVVTAPAVTQAISITEIVQVTLLGPEVIAAALPIELVAIAAAPAEIITPVEVLEVISIQAVVPATIAISTVAETILATVPVVPQPSVVESFTSNLLPYALIIPVPDHIAPLDCSLAQAFKVDCTGLQYWAVLEVTLLNWPLGVFAEVFLLLENVPASGIGIIWPAEAQAKTPPLSMGFSNEYVFRSWDGGGSLILARTAVYESTVQ